MDCIHSEYFLSYEGDKAESEMSKVTVLDVIDSAFNPSLEESLILYSTYLISVFIW
jgi:hypothetical protein